MKYLGTPVLAALLLAGTGCAARVPAPVGAVDRLAARVEVLTDGGLDVREDVTLVPDASGTVVFSRAIRAARADSVEFSSFSIGDRAIDPGTDGLTVVADGPDRVRVTWRGQSQAGPVHLTWGYRALAAVAVREPRGRLEWPVLVAGRGFDVGTVVVTLVLPDGATVYDGTGMAEAGWTVENVPHGVTARHARVPDASAVTLLAVFDIDHARAAQSAWELNLDRQDQYFLALVAAGLFIFVIGIGTLVLVRVQYPPVASTAGADVCAAAAADRRMLARGLWLSAWVGLVFSAFCAWLADRTLGGLGPAVQWIPGSMAAVFVMFALAAPWYARSARRLTR